MDLLAEVGAVRPAEHAREVPAGRVDVHPYSLALDPNFAAQIHRHAVAVSAPGGTSPKRQHLFRGGKDANAEFAVSIKEHCNAVPILLDANVEDVVFPASRHGRKR